MIFDPKNLPFSDVHKLMIGSIVPRPIAFVSTVSNKGERNIAPFSYFNGVCSNPPTIMFAPARRGWDGEEKDTLVNIKQNQEFVVNIVSEKIAEKMVEGRIRKFYQEVVLLEQTFVIDGESKIADVLKKTAHEAGGEIVLKEFSLFVLGDGIEKEETDFAAEVAAQLNK